MNKCSCGNCDLEIFENSDKCILHCDKTKYYENKYELNPTQILSKDKMLKEFETKFIEIYYKEINEDILILSYIHFPEDSFNKLLEIINSIRIQIFKCKFYENIGLKKENLNKKLEYLNFFNCDMNTINIVHINIDIVIDIYDCNFKKLCVQFAELNELKINKVKSLNIIINDSTIDCLSISDSSLNYLGFFNGTNKKTILKNVKIENTEFNTTFLDRLDFIDVEIKNKIDLQNSFIPTNSLFFGLKSSKGILDVANRETARKIKDSFEKQNNIIEANKYYALEMKEREKELSPKKDFFEWLVFKIHGLSSNHSQDWTLALFWIINLTFFYSYLNIQPNDKILVFKIIFSCIAISVIACMTIKIPEENKERRWLRTIPTTIVCYGFYGFFSQDWLLKCFSNKLNPFSIMTGNEELTFSGLIYKIIIAYLIYQLIISIRQNTRRK
ncbi:hypothetical protein [Aliarcobacter butzleri]|uniref:hypothetical protein n=1 Tax=Aliarcobacter butzleri TaxID=28197 RepID=UPI001260C81C|nr:hypothetical protein [Aliarcobacter butzleri]MCT7625897.1 hypothetical protein [Aliarcobacter butzleri]MCT7643569.1 hypothetical protein [Aliarcobacter butzleri]